jgi:hypothetical protein
MYETAFLLSEGQQHQNNNKIADWRRTSGTFNELDSKTNNKRL